MKSKKQILIVISILLIYFIIMFLLFGWNRVVNKFQYLDIIISPDTYIQYRNGYFKDYKNTTEMLGNGYSIFVDHQYQYDGNLQYSQNKWYAFDKNYQSLSLPENFFAYRGNMKVEVVSNFTVEELTTIEEEEAYALLEKKQIHFERIALRKEKIIYDYDGDGKSEVLFIIQNSLPDKMYEEYFCIAYLKKGNKIQELISDVSKDMYDIPLLMLSEIIDYNEDKKQELIFSKIYFDQIGTCHQILQLNEKKIYETIKKCEIIKRGDEEV